MARLQKTSAQIKSCWRPMKCWRSQWLAFWWVETKIRPQLKMHSTASLTEISSRKRPALRKGTDAWRAQVTRPMTWKVSWKIAIAMLQSSLILISLALSSSLDSDGFEFQIVSLDNKIWHFEASSVDEREEWVTAIEHQILSSLQGNESSKSKSRMNSLVDAASIQSLRSTVIGNANCADCDAPSTIFKYFLSIILRIQWLTRFF